MHFLQSFVVTTASQPITQLTWLAQIVETVNHATPTAAQQESKGNKRWLTLVAPNCLTSDCLVLSREWGNGLLGLL